MAIKCLYVLSDSACLRDWLPLLYASRTRIAKTNKIWLQTNSILQEKMEHKPNLSEQELLVQQSAVRVVAISLLGKHKVGGWPSNVETELENVSAQNRNRERSNSSTKRVILPEFTCMCPKLVHPFGCSLLTVII